jgi:cell wall-associated NlpC family hydrolase
MQEAQPLGLSRRRVEQLLLKTKSHGSPASRIDALSHYFLGRPYKANLLIGSSGTPEVFTASLDGFDCVTYIETILALARASHADDFTKWLQRIRYEDGRIQWTRRNHYMTGWIRNNTKAGVVRLLSLPPKATVMRSRVLNLLPGLAPKRVRVKCIPKSDIHRLEPSLETGDLIFFASTRKNLDVFHGGIIVRDGQTLLMRHASRSRGLVVEQGLDEFLKANRMAGVIVVRPV